MWWSSSLYDDCGGSDPCRDSVVLSSDRWMVLPGITRMLMVMKEVVVVDDSRCVDHDPHSHHHSYNYY